MPCRHSCFAPICPVVAVPEVLFVKPKGFQQISEFIKKKIFIRYLGSSVTVPVVDQVFIWQTAMLTMA